MKTPPPAHFRFSTFPLHVLQTRPIHLCLASSGPLPWIGRRLLFFGFALVLSLLVPKGHAQPASDTSPLNWIDGVTVGIGINTFHGDVDSDDGPYTLPRTLTTAGLDVRLGVDHRFGPGDRLGTSAHLVYDRIYGEGSQGWAFTNNLLSLELTGEYEPSWVQDNLFRFFAGGGPTLIFLPSYANLPEGSSRNIAKELGPRVVGTLVFGVQIADRVRIGLRMATTDYLDGLRTTGRNYPVDLLGFVNVGYRFDLSN